MALLPIMRSGYERCIAVKNPQDYEARSNIMWTATWALNTLIGLGKRQDWMVHTASKTLV